MKVYLAAMYSLKEMVRKRAEDLSRLGIECTSTWLDEPHAPSTGLKEVTPEFCIETAHKDLSDILRSDVMVLFTEEPTTPTLRGGRHFESGFAYGIAMAQTLKLVAEDAFVRPMQVMTVGPRENIFHHLELIRNHGSWNDALLYLIDYKTCVDQYDALRAEGLADGTLVPMRSLDQIKEKLN